MACLHVVARHFSVQVVDVMVSADKHVLQCHTSTEHNGKWLKHEHVWGEAGGTQDQCCLGNNEAFPGVLKFRVSLPIARPWGSRVVACLHVALGSLGLQRECACCQVRQVS